MEKPLLLTVVIGILYFGTKLGEMDFMNMRKTVSTTNKLVPLDDVVEILS
jgi:hypothetical protein